MVIKQLKLKTLEVRLSKIYWNKGYNCSFTGCGQNCNVGHSFICLDLDLIQPWCDYKCLRTLHLVTSILFM